MSTIPKHVEFKINAKFPPITDWNVIDTSGISRSAAAWGYQLATDGREELENQITQLKGMAIIKDARIDYDKDQITALQSSLKEKEKECEELISWKERAMEVMRPLQSIGHSMGVRLGETIHDKILPFIEELKAENERLKAKAWMYDQLNK